MTGELNHNQGQTNMKKNLERYIRPGRPLRHTVEAIKRGKITIGFVGGSITEPANGTRWSDKTADWFVLNYPEVSVNVENAAKGATGSLSAVFRIEEDINACGCDLVLVETAVNDGPDAWGACREGILRKLLKDDRCDVIVTYTYSSGFYEDMLAGRIPRSMIDWEELVEHYDLPRVYMSRYAFDLMLGGYVRWEEWLPDGLHPGHAGSRLYAEPVTELIGCELDCPRAAEPFALPEPLHADCWEDAQALPFDSFKRVGAWRMVRERRIPSVRYIMFTTSMSSSLEFEFEGTGLVVHTMVNSWHAGYTLSVDGGEPVNMAKPLPEWGVNATDWVREDVPVKGLPFRKHKAVLKPVFCPGAKGANFELCAVGVIR